MNLEAGQIEIHRHPSGARYGNIHAPRADETFSPVAFPDLTLALRDLLG